MPKTNKSPVPTDHSLVQKALSLNHFKSIVRMIKTSSLDRVSFLGNAIQVEMKRLGLKEDDSRAWKGVPEGSDQGSPMSIINWMKKVTPEDKKAKKQIIALDATARKRTE